MKRIIVLTILSLALLTGLLSVSARDFSIAIGPIHSAAIEEKLYHLLESSEDGEILPVAIWVQEIDQERLESQLISRVGLSKDLIIENYINRDGCDYSFEEIDTYINEKRRLYQIRQYNLNSSFIRDNPMIQGRVTFISRYSPVIIAELDKDTILALAKESNVLEIDYAPPFKLAPEMNVSLPLIRADYVRDTLNYSGTGVKVGLLEYSNVDKSGGAFDSSKIHNYHESYTVGPHATAVASIICSIGYGSDSPSYIGIAPNVHIYCANNYVTPFHYDIDDHYYELIEWLIGKGVHIINMSSYIPNNGDGGVVGGYGFYEKWADHIAITHSVHFVKSSGNTAGGDGYITRPGTAYNIITVGGIDDHNTSSESDDSIYAYSSYEELSGKTNKPDICAPAVSITYTYADGTLEHLSGTSFAAPHVTGVIAQLLDAKPSLMVLQDTVKAIIAASVHHSVLRFDSSDSNYDMFGAGVVDARGSIYTARHNCYANSYFSANCSAGSYKSYTFSVSSTDSYKRVALSWLNNSQVSGDTHQPGTVTVGTTPNLDLEIYDPSGNLVASCDDLYNNLDVIELDSPSVGTYTARVVCTTPSNRKTYFFIAWY